MKILVIEDETKVANFLQKGLRQSGYEVDTAADGEEGYDKIRNDGYDLILLDLMLPVFRPISRAGKAVSIPGLQQF